MPVIAVNVAPGILSRINELISSGGYVSAEQFLEIAALNQLALERGSSPEELVERGLRNPGALASKKTDERSPEPKRSKKGRSRKKRRTKAAAKAAVRAQAASTDPAELESVLPALALPNAVALPPPMEATPRPADEYVWGQVNRLFPLKLATRWLLTANAGRDAWRTIDDIGEKLADVAASIGSALDSADLEHDRKRGDALATGLPRKGNLGSSDRFLTQFIARTTRAGDLYPGAICQYALAHFHGDQLALTDVGVELARLQNPIIDGSFNEAEATLSEEEQRIFIDRVLPLVPGERKCISVILAAVESGKGSPEALLGAVGGSFPEQWSETVAKTHLSGVVARMVEMGLLLRHWEGRQVQYQITDMAAMVKEQT